MKPNAANHVPAHVHPMPTGGMSMRDQAVHSPLHRLQDVKLDPPYRQQEIDAYLHERQVRSTGDLAFDACLFQSELFTDFFKKIEAVEIEPGQPEHDRPAQYLLKKSVELLQPLGLKIEAACQGYDELLKTNSPRRGLKELKEQLPYVEGMTARFRALESNLLAAVNDPQTFRPSRDKACFLLVAHAMLADAAEEIQGLVDHFSFPAAKSSHILWNRSGCKEIWGYLTAEDTNCTLFSPGSLTPEDASRYKQFLTYVEAPPDGMENAPVPTFSKTGTQGVLAILNGIFHRSGLLGGAIDRPLAVHGNFYEQHHLATLRHDGEHLQVMVEDCVLSASAPQLEPIYCKLKNPHSCLPVQDVKKDLLVLFYLLHENATVTEMLGSSRPRDRSFLLAASIFFDNEFNVIDMIPLLNKVGFSIASFDARSTDKEKEACGEAVAQGMTSLWKEFRERHARDLAISGLFAKLPKFLAD